MGRGMSEDEIRASILEEMYEYHWREATAMSRCLIFAQDHYTYRDLERAHLIAAEWTAREHMGLLKYDESEKRLRIIRDRVIADHKQLMEAEKIA
jgi:hypothetical protein